jgi:hypothetical protein
MSWALLVLLSPAGAHEFQIHALEPSDEWCAEAHRVAVPGDILQLAPGTYPGGCDLTLGGEPELNEALLVQGADDGSTVIEADADGLSLRVSGEPTRLYQLDLRGRLEVVVDGTTIDSSTVGCLQVDGEVQRLTVLFSELAELQLNLAEAVVRGNRLGAASVVADAGLVADNEVHGDLSTTLPTQRNLVLGDLSVAGEGTSNIVVGTAEAERLAGNTLLGPVYAAEVVDNLTTVAVLDPSTGNLHCPTCLADAEALDVQPVGEALTAPVHDTTTTGFCLQPATTVGAVAPVGEGWTAFDRDRLGCAVGLVDAPPLAPEPGRCEPTEALQERPSLEVVPAKGCSVPASGPVGYPWCVLLLMCLRRSR